jgi:site-specific recombinase XerD
VDANALVLREWTHALKAEHKSDATVRSYIESARMLAQFLAAENSAADPYRGKHSRLRALPAAENSAPAVLEATPDDLRRFIADLLERRSPSTAAVRYRSLQQFYGWAVRDGLRADNPMATMRPPTIPETRVPVVAIDDLRKLLRACEGRDFLELRDTALIRLMLEPGGMRRAEVIGLRVEDLDLENDVVVVLGKGRRPRAIPYGHRTGQALTRYLRARMKHQHAKLTDALWLAQKGPLTDNGLAQMLERRCTQAGIPRIKPHQLRHTSADLWLSESGGDETSAMRLFGWRSRQMLQRYAASNADARAREAARRLGIGDKL